MNKNIEYTERYLSHLLKIFDLGWEINYKNLETQNLDIDYIMIKIALLHPNHFQFIGITGTEINKIQEKIQGKRSFTSGHVSFKCSSIEIWGYECPFQNEILVLDHDYPYSFGGPTDNAFNKRTLCRWHNMIKGNDIHFYNWNQLFENYLESINNQRKHWIDLQLEKYNQVISPYLKSK